MKQLHRVHSAIVDRVIVVLEGDQTGQGYSERRASCIPTSSASSCNCRGSTCRSKAAARTKNAVVHEAARAIAAHGLGLKAATITGRDGVGSPNRILREEIGGKVIVRTGRRIPGVLPVGGVHSPISVVRMAVGDAYGAQEWREGEGDAEVAFRTERIERRICRAVAEFAFRQADRTVAKVFGGPKYTVSPIYEGMLKEEMDAAAERHPDVPYEPQLIDATFAVLISSSGAPMVIPALNRDGDILGCSMLPLFGSIAGSESLLVAFGDDGVDQPTALMSEAAHGTAPALEGKDVANPMAMILAAAALLAHSDDDDCQQAGRAIREGDAQAVAEGVRGRRSPEAPRHERVHRRGDQAHPHEARGLVVPVDGASRRADRGRGAREGRSEFETAASLLTLAEPDGVAADELTRARRRSIRPPRESPPARTRTCRRCDRRRLVPTPVPLRARSRALPA